MPIPLTDGAFVGDGSQIGMLPVLADQPLDKASTLLRSSTNPRMDLILLVVKDAASSAAGGAGAAAPPGMSAAQYALVQRMLAARQRGGQAASGGAVAPEPKRGPQIHLVLWRMGDSSSEVWSVALSWDKAMDSPGVTQQEHEDVFLQDVAWSPKGDRLGVLASVRRSPVASTSTSTSRSTTFLRTYSVQDGRLLSTVQIGTENRLLPASPDADNFAQPLGLQWVDIDLASTNPTVMNSVDASSESLLTKFSPLPALPPADTFASAGGGGNLMPHQLRMMQMSGQKPPPGFQFPSQLALQGRGSLAGIPHLAKSNADLGLLEAADAVITGMVNGNDDLDRALPLCPESVVMVSHPSSAQVCLVMDGQINIGSLHVSPQPLQEGQDCPLTMTLDLAHDMTQLRSLIITSNTTVSLAHFKLPLSSNTRYGPSDIRRRILAVSRSSHLLRFYLGYALDTASALQQVYQKEYVQKVTSEWGKNIDDLSLKFGGDMKYELINVLLTGRAGPAAEQFLLGNLTEGVLTRLEAQAHTALYAIKKLISESFKPSLERSIIALSGLIGQTKFFSGNEGGAELQEVLRILQATLDSCLSLAKDVDMEAVISQEFYRWCRTERERQERIKQDQDEPRLAVTYDVLTVAEYIERGFENVGLQKRLGSNSDGLQIDGTSTEGKRSLREALEAAKAFLATTGKREHVVEPSSKQNSSKRKEVLAIVPTLNIAIEKLALPLARLFDAKLEDAGVTSAAVTSTAINGGGDLMMEAPPAISLSSSASSSDVDTLSQRICSTSFISSNNSMLSATILRPDHDQSILVLHADESSFLTRAHFTVPTTTTHAAVSILDLGFYGDSELLVLASIPTTKVSILLAFNLLDLPFKPLTTSQGLGTASAMPGRATEFEAEFRPNRLAVNMNKQTVAVIGEDGKRVLYLDIASVVLETGTTVQEEGADVIMQEDE